MRGRGGDVAGGVARVVIAAGYGGPEVLSVTEEPMPGPGPGEARIEVRAVGVNPVDLKAYSGAFGTDPARLPIRLGAEAAAPGADPGIEIRERARLDLTRLAGERKLRVIVSQTFRLAEAAAAHRMVRDGHTTGKLALIP